MRKVTMVALKAIATTTFVIALVHPHAAAAQDVPSSLEALQASGLLRPGEPIVITDRFGQRTKATLEQLSPASLEVLTDNQQQRFTADGIWRIERRDSIQNGLWIGVAAGIAAAIIAPRVACDLPDPECSAIVVAAIGLPAIGAGAVAGALTDAAIRKTVYQALPGSARLQFTPVLSGTTKGIMASLRF